MSTVKLIFLTEDAYLKMNDRHDTIIQATGPAATQDHHTWLNSKEVAKILGISTWTLRSYRTDGKIAYYQFNRKILYMEADVMQAIENFRVPSFSTIKNTK